MAVGHRGRVTIALYRFSVGAILALTTGVIANTVSTPPACACSCATPSAPEKAVSGYDAVFVGVPTRRVRRGDRAVYQFAVSQVYNGNVGTVVTVGTNADSAACGAHFDLGKETLLYASDSDSGETLFVAGLCRPADWMGFDLAEATYQTYGPPQPPDPAAPTDSIRLGLGTLVVAAFAQAAVFGGVGVTLFRRHRLRRHPRAAA